MTPEDIDKLEAGRELDAELHKVLWPLSLPLSPLSFYSLAVSDDMLAQDTY